MRYIFETGQYPYETTIDDKEFPTNNEAIKHAISINADYVWDCPDNHNPTTVYRKSVDTLMAIDVAPKDGTVIVGLYDGIEIPIRWVDHRT